MERTDFANLRVYQLAEQLADDVWEIVIEWDLFARDTVGKQVVRSADGISASEGSGRGSVQDNRRFVYMARGSLYETRNWLRRAYRRKLLTVEQIESPKTVMDELTLTLSGYLRSLSGDKKS